jgi:O-antigen/teichoic acid export membrane protein
VIVTQLRRRSFGARYLTLFAGETFSKVCVLGAFAYLARVLPPEHYGIVELALSLTVFVMLGVESGMGLYGARIVAADPGRIARLVPQIMALRALMALVAYAAILAADARYRTPLAGLLIVNGLAVLWTPWLTQWVFQGLRQMQWVAGGSALRNLVFVTMVVALVRPGSDVRLVAVAEVTGIAALALFNIFILHRRLRLRLEWRGAVDGVGGVFKDVWFLGLGDFTWACLWYSPGIIAGWLGGPHLTEVAWIAASIRIVLALHTFVWLYFFNLLPNLSAEVSRNLDDWRDLVQRSMRTSLWPAGLIGVGGTLLAPLLIPAIYGDTYRPAVPAFQIAIWMIPITWFSGHFRFSLIAAGLQRWEFAASAATAVVTVVAALVLVPQYGSNGAAAALLTGGAFNTVLAFAFMTRGVGAVQVMTCVRWVVLAATLGLGLGLAASASIGTLGGTVLGSAAYVAIGFRQREDILKASRLWLRSKP